LRAGCSTRKSTDGHPGAGMGLGALIAELGVSRRSSPGTISALFVLDQIRADLGLLASAARCTISGWR